MRCLKAAKICIVLNLVGVLVGTERIELSRPMANGF
jgi:hypothetical protein